MRAAIEAETNRRAGVPYATLNVDERVALLAGTRRTSGLTGRHLTACAANVRYAAERAASPGDLPSRIWDSPLSPGVRTERSASSPHRDLLRMKW